VHVHHSSPILQPKAQRAWYGRHARARCRERAARVNARAQLLLALAGVVGVAGVLPAWPPLDAGFAVKALLVGAAASALAWPWLRACGRGFALRAANQITLLRAALVVLMAALLGEPHAASLAAVVVVLASVAVVLDGVDGWVARRSNTATAFGARFDMETDAAMILVLALLAWQWGKAGPWVLLAGLARYAFVAAACALAWLRRPLPASRRRRVVCQLQTMALIACVAPLIPYPASALLAAAGLTALGVSFTLDIHWLARRAHAAPTAEYAHDSS
jgi:phosphatidylglycerophosphate synthase